MIAITGANGLLGSYLVRNFITTNQPFVALKRKGGDVSLLADVAPHIVWREADVNDYDGLVEALKDVNEVIHTAAVVSYHQRDKQKIHQVNVLGTRNVVNACLQQGVKRLLHVSSVAALGKAKGQAVVDEESKWISDVRVSNYAESKYLAELEAWRGQEEGLEVVVVNPAVILAPTNWEKSSAQLFKYAWDERPFYTGGAFSAVDVRDVANCIAQLVNSAIVGERYIITADTISYYDFFRLAALHFGKKPPHIKVSNWLLQAAAVVEGLRAWLTRSTPLVTKETAQVAARVLSYRNDKVKKALGIEFQSIESTITWCCAEYMKKIAFKK